MRTRLRSRQFCLLSLCILLTQAGYSQVTQEWIARFATSYNGLGELAKDMTIDKQRNVYVTGATLGANTSYDFTTIKYNSAGELQWVSRYSGPGISNDEPAAIAVDDKGNVYVTGRSDGDGTGIDYDYATIKLNSAGVIQWATRYNGPGNGEDAADDIA